MNKVSTAAVKATKNFSQPKLTIGLDLGDRSSWYCLHTSASPMCLRSALRFASWRTWPQCIL
jgi:hypothetical protein